MTEYPPSAWERAMRVQEVILRAASGEITWIRAADILGISARSLRRWKKRWEEYGYDGLLDRRTGRPSPKRVPFDEAQRILHLYRGAFLGQCPKSEIHYTTSSRPKRKCDPRRR